MSREALKPIKMSMEASSSIHKNVSQGYYQLSPAGEKVFVPYDKNEIGEIHCFISPSINKRKRMKWTKTHKWKDQEKAQKSKWYHHPTFGGLNTVKA